MPNPGTWKVNASRRTIIDAKSMHRYRICNSPDSKQTRGVYLVLDGTQDNDRLLAGECRDVLAAKIEINQPEGNNSSGTFDNLD